MTQSVSVEVFMEACIHTLTVQMFQLLIILVHYYYPETFTHTSNYYHRHFNFLVTLICTMEYVFLMGTFLTVKVKLTLYTLVIVKTTWRSSNHNLSHCRMVLVLLRWHIDLYMTSLLSFCMMSCRSKVSVVDWEYGFTNSSFKL